MNNFMGSEWRMSPYEAFRDWAAHYVAGCVDQFYLQLVNFLLGLGGGVFSFEVGLFRQLRICLDSPTNVQFLEHIGEPGLYLRASPT